MHFRFAFLLLAVLCLAQQTQEPAKVSGRTVNLAGEGVRKTRLLLSLIPPSADVPSKNYTTASDAEGRFAFEAVDPGKYTLFAEKAGYLRQSYGAKEMFSSGTPITLSAGQNLSDLTFTLIPQSSVSGRVLNEDGDPLPHAFVRIMRPMYRDGKRMMATMSGSQADESGEFKIGGLSAGRYVVCAASTGYSAPNAIDATKGADPNKPKEALVSTCYPSAPDPASAAPLEVVAGHNITGTDIRMRKARVVRVKGKVVGAPAGQQVRLSLYAREANAANIGSSSNIGKDGSFEISNVQAGSFELYAMSQDRMPAILGRQPLEVGAENIEGVMLTLIPPGELKGIVKTEGTPPAQTPSIQIRLAAMDGVSFGQMNVHASADGTFTIPNVGVGRYRAIVFGAPEGAYLKSIRYGDQEALASGIDLSSGVAGELQVVFQMGAADITGTVKDDQGQISAGSTVTLLPDPPNPEQAHLYKVTPADQNGAFTFKNLAPGLYRVYAWATLEQGAQFDPDFLKPHTSESIRLELKENSHERVDLVRIR
jgi:hypothetical protein